MRNTHRSVIWSFIPLQAVILVSSPPAAARRLFLVSPRSVSWRLTAFLMLAGTICVSVKLCVEEEQGRPLENTGAAEFVVMRRSNPMPYHDQPLPCPSLINLRTVLCISFSPAFLINWHPDVYSLMKAI